MRIVKIVRGLGRLLKKEKEDQDIINAYFERLLKREE